MRKGFSFFFFCFKKNLMTFVVLFSYNELRDYQQREIAMQGVAVTIKTIVYLRNICFQERLQLFRRLT